MIVTAVVMAVAMVGVLGFEAEAQAGTQATVTAVESGKGIRVGQAGYPVGGRKEVVVAGEVGDEVVVRKGGVEVARVKLGAGVLDADSGDLLRAADVSGVREAGVYEVVVGEMRGEMQVGEDVWRRPLYLAMRSFYGQRCGCAVDMGAEFPGMKYEACHTAMSPYHASAGKEGERDCTGGWHDAGDYGKYVVNSNITVGTLLWGWEMYGAKLGGLGLAIPESGGKLPDYLAEVKWNLDWMHKMQDGDGGLFHKATTERFPGMVMPKDDTKPVAVIGLGQEPWKVTTATAGFAAVAAVAARVYAPFDEAYAAKNLQAAERAFAWAVKNPAALYRKNPEGIATGAYGDGEAGDELLWAAAELFRTTGKAEYDAYFREHCGKWSVKGDEPQAWPRVGNLGLYAYAIAKGADEAIVARIKGEAKAAADAIVARTRGNGYRIPMLAKDYNWGSNSGVMNYAMMVLVADRLGPDAAYQAAAEDMLHYVFGRNHFGTSFVTHVGTKWAMRPHHRPSAADGIDQPWPGLIVGGPNGRDFNREKKVNVPPARGWTDETGSYTTNENAINWNAPLVFVLAGVLDER